MSLDLASPTFLDDVYAALFAQLQTAVFPAGIKINTFLRVILPPDAIPPDQQPTLVLAQGPIEVSQKQARGVIKYLLTAVVFVFFRADGASPIDQSPIPIQTSNYIVWGLAQTLSTPAGGQQTLGDKVYHCWIEGPIHCEVVDPQVLLSIPIHIEV